MDNSGEPFGLPAGTVRGLITIAITGLVIFSFATNQVTETLLAFAGPYLGYYFATRQASTTLRDATAPEPLDPPAIANPNDERN